IAQRDERSQRQQGSFGFVEVGREQPELERRVRVGAIELVRRGQRLERLDQIVFAQVELGELAVNAGQSAPAWARLAPEDAAHDRERLLSAPGRAEQPRREKQRVEVV